ncbi:methyltransferase domain-containing protein [Plantactinospora siamensis]|uniref:Methyltransferase domain-containing protein n=1 Tax=Plantactinospora siamensis TaxID=555372 RepID=A0ABV6P0N1_9ACTN
MARYTHGHHESVLRSHRWRTAENSAGYLLPVLRRGMTVLDVGCGPATITADLARLVAGPAGPATDPTSAGADSGRGADAADAGVDSGRGADAADGGADSGRGAGRADGGVGPAGRGRVTALELTPEALATGSAEVAASGLGNVDLLVADAHALPFPDDRFDVVHAHQVLQHVADPVRMLTELRRVCRPGGHVAVRDSDYAAFAWHPRLPELDDWLALYRRLARANGGEPDAGRRLLSWAQQAGFTEVTATSSTWCFATPADRAWWGGMWADRVTRSAVADQARAAGVTDRELRRLADGWRAWADSDDGWLSVLHGEVLARP